MNALLAVALLPLHFTAPADSLGVDAAGRARMSPDPVHAYVFYRLGENGAITTVTGYADSGGVSALVPHAPGTRETAWLETGADGGPVKFYMQSLDAHGNLSAPSNECVVTRPAAPAPRESRAEPPFALEVPIVIQARERCGPAALEMVLRYYGAAPAALGEAERAYDPALRGSLITDLAAAARRAGYTADVATLAPDSLIKLLGDGVPPIVLYQNGSRLATFRHFGVITGWDSVRAAFTLNDGGARPRVARRADLARRWATAGSQALVIRRGTP